MWFRCMELLVLKLLPYSRKYWRELNLAVEPQIAILTHWWYLNLAVRYRITVRIYELRRILIWLFERRLAKLPTLNPRQIFRLYGIRAL